MLGLILAADLLEFHILVQSITISRRTPTRTRTTTTILVRNKRKINDNCDNRTSERHSIKNTIQETFAYIRSIQFLFFFSHFIFGFRQRQCCAAHVKCGRRPHSHQTWMHYYLWVWCGGRGAQRQVRQLTNIYVYDVVFQLRIAKSLLVDFSFSSATLRTHAAHFIKFLIWTCRRRHMCPFYQCWGPCKRARLAIISVVAEKPKEKEKWSISIKQLISW